MSRTINTMPLEIQRFEHARLRPPEDVDVIRWSRRPRVRYMGTTEEDRLEYRAAWQAWHDRREEVLAELAERDSWRFRCGYPGAYGGAWPGRKEWGRIRNRRLRAQAKDLIRHGEYDLLPVPRKEVAWDIW